MMTAALLLLQRRGRRIRFSDTDTPGRASIPVRRTRATQTPALRRPDRRAGKEDQRRLRRRHGRRRTRQAVGPDVPARRARCWSRRSPAACASSARTARSPPAVTGLPPVDARGQGGLLDVLLDRQFASNQLIYWSYSEPAENQVNNTAVARGKFVDGAAPRVENVAGDLSPGAVAGRRRCTSAAGWSGTATARCS